MIAKSVYLYEWRHFVRSPYKVVALLLFLVAAVYGLHNGASLYQRQMVDIDAVEAEAREIHERNLACYDEGKKSPDDLKYADIGEPFWSIWYMSLHHVKRPSPAMVYSTGQAEHFGYYKRIRQTSSPYDPDMAPEIANPERLQFSPLDFTFVLLYLQPLLLLILLHNIRGAEVEQGVLPLVEVQAGSERTWVAARLAFYVSVVFALDVALLVYGALLTGVLPDAVSAFGEMLAWTASYLLLWAVVTFAIVRCGKTVVSNTLQIAGVWLLFAFVIPASVHRVVSICYPTNLMTGFIDATREEKQAVIRAPVESQMAMVDAIYPGVVDGPAAEEEGKRRWAMQWSRFALWSDMTKRRVAPIEAESDAKNRLIRFSYWFNPITFFQGRLNSVAQTHYDDYRRFRSEIQTLVDRNNRIVVTDTWADVSVSKAKYLGYFETLSKP